MDKISDVTQELQALNQITALNNEELIGIGASLETISSDVSSLYGMLLDTSSSSLEERREQKRQNEQMLAALEGQPGGGTGSGAGGEEDGGGGLLGGLGLAGAGVGLGAAGFGALLAGGGYLLDKMMEIDGELIKENVIALLSIPDEVSDGSLAFFGESAAFSGAMTALGVGLAAFALGSGVAAAVNYFTKDSTFAQTVKDNVAILLSIPESVGKSNLDVLAKSGTFIGAMSALGAGLAVFGVGSSIAGLSDALTDFLNPNFAESIKRNVITLLSISDTVDGLGDAFAKSGTFVGIMGGLAAGLALFGAGSSVAGIGSAIADFQDPAWAQSIKDNVITLLSIEDALGGKLAAFGETGTFVAIMGGISAGLAAFGIGKTAAAIADTISSSDWTQTIKQNVQDLLGITDLLDGDGEDSKAGRFAAGMAKISAGLLAFSGSDFLGSLANAAKGVLNFVTGSESPIAQVMKIADKSDKLMKGANALEKITNALNKFGSIEVSVGGIDFEGLVKNLSRSIPLIEKLGKGGVYDAGFFGGGKIDFGAGLLDPSLKLDELAEQVAKVNYVLGRSSTPPSSMGSNETSETENNVESLSTDRRPSGQLSMAAEERQSLEAEQDTRGNGGGLNVQNNSSTNVTNNAQTVLKPLDGPTRPPRSARDVQFAAP